MGGGPGHVPSLGGPGPPQPPLATPTESSVAVVPHIRVTVGGSMTGQVSTPEILSFGFALADPAGGPSISLPAAAQTLAIANAVKTFWTAPQSAISSQACLRSVKVSLIGPSGRVAFRDDGSYFQDLYSYGPVEVKGGGTTDVQPYQLCIVASLASSAGSGAKRGRMFLPCVGQPVQPDGLITVGAADNVLGRVKALFTTINGLPPAEVVAIASEGSVKKGLPPRNYPVTSLRVGRVYDTMRSRRNALTESYSQDAL